MYLSPILMRSFLDPLPGNFILRASPSFSVTTHSLTLPASNRPMKVAFVLCKDITFSKRTQKTIKWNDLHHSMILLCLQINVSFVICSEVKAYAFLLLHLDHKVLEKISTLECQQHSEGWWWLGYTQNPTLVFQPQELRLWQGWQCSKTQRSQCVLWSCAQGRSCRWHGFFSKVSLSASRLTHNLLETPDDCPFNLTEKNLVQGTLFLTISINIFLNRFAGPHDHLCCW